MISVENLRALVDQWLGQGMRVAGPARAAGRVFYLPLSSGADLAPEGFVHPVNSAKDLLFPKTETLYRYRVDGRRIELIDEPETRPPQVLLAVRPCDAAAFPILDHVFEWDFQDEFYLARRRNTTIVALACTGHDDHCFCTSVGLGPASERGADALLIPAEGGFQVRSVTDKGRALFPGQQAEASVANGPEKRFDPAAVRKFAETNFQHPLWAEQSLACLGCGACAYTCPTCHCFDIVDEHGARVRNWDACQFGQFTLHASGHNPRPDQGSRQRQRILHKFSIYPQKFGEILCTGCGNCTRNCPAGLGVLPVLQAIDNEQHLQA